MLGQLETLTEKDLGLVAEAPVQPGGVLHSILLRLPDGSPEVMERPLTPLLDTTVLTNAPGEPVLVHETRAEIPSSDSIDVLMAFIRWSGVRTLLEPLRRHCQAGKPLRVLTTTYTNSTEQRALDELVALGATVRVSYDTAITRLHAKAWLFHRTRLLDCLYRLVEPHAFGSGDRPRVERPAVGGPQPRRSGEDRGRL